MRSHDHMKQASTLLWWSLRITRKTYDKQLFVTSKKLWGKKNSTKFEKSTKNDSTEFRKQNKKTNKKKKTK